MRTLGFAPRPRLLAGVLLVSFLHTTLGTSGSTESVELEDAVQQVQSQTGFNLTGPVWIPQRFNITCCLGGTPLIRDARFARNLTSHMLDYVIDESSPHEDARANCRTFGGKFLISPSHFFEEGFSHRSLVTCQCPDVGIAGELDRHCRRLPKCHNNGIRAQAGARKCLCKRPFFGEQCEKLCDQGQPMKDPFGNDYCSCIPYYQGEECKQLVCMHGGREEAGRCLCPPQFLGFHCEIDTNKTNGNGMSGSRFQRFGDQGGEMFTRDISGTIFSLIMIVVLVVSMYLLMKHRMQVQTRYLHRRPDLLGACNFPVSPSTGQSCLSRRTELRPPHDDPRVYPFRQIVPTFDGGPPPYVAPGQRSRRSRSEVLPPLPSYEDATKMPPLRHNVRNEDSDAVDVVSPTSSEAPVECIHASMSSSNSSNCSSSHASSEDLRTCRRTCAIEMDAASDQVVVHETIPVPTSTSTPTAGSTTPSTAPEEGSGSAGGHGQC